MKIFMFVNSCDAFIKELLHVSTKVVKEEEKAQKFHQYFDWSEPLSKAPSHRLLAMLRS
jgi:transcriptional accessory protein Tex/SPT6